MSSCTSTFGEADYGCSEQGSLTAAFEVTPASFTHDPNIPNQANITLNVTSTLTVNNVQYDTTTDQDISAWLALTSSTTPLVESDKTFVPRENCASTTNTLPTTVSLNIASGDEIKAKGKWSGFEGSQVGTDVPNCDWFDVELGNNFTITPPQNLQVTFPSDPTGEINASIDAWSLNPNISGTPFVPIDENDELLYNNWNWRVELLDSLENVVSANELTMDNNLSQALTANVTSLQPNTEYRMRVTVSNEYQATATVTSPIIYSKPAAPIIRRVTFTKESNGTYTAHIEWAKPRGGTFDETIKINGTAIADVVGGASTTGTYDITGLQPGVPTAITISSTSTSGQSQTAETIYPPANIPTISAEWNDVRRCVNISAQSDNISSFNMTAGYMRGDDSLANETDVDTISLCDLEHGNNEVVYVSATPTVPNHIYTDRTAYSTIPIPNPILGVSNDCSEMLNVVDIVESKNGILTPKWQTGVRVKTQSGCPGVG